MELGDSPLAINIHVDVFSRHLRHGLHHVVCLCISLSTNSRGYSCANAFNARSTDSGSDS